MPAVGGIGNTGGYTTHISHSEEEKEEEEGSGEADRRMNRDSGRRVVSMRPALDPQYVSSKEMRAWRRQVQSGRGDAGQRVGGSLSLSPCDPHRADRQTNGRMEEEEGH